jgi:hypothetical protein
MVNAYARGSTDGNRVDAQVFRLTKARCRKMAGEVASCVKTDRTHSTRVIASIKAAYVAVIARLDCLAPSTCDLPNTLDMIADLCRPLMKPRPQC